jgi:NADP-dependent 3-hydroxy acid dehydrogenase YdfG
MQKTILITGAGRGIGHAIAEALYSGNKLILITKTRASYLRIRKEFPKALCYACDITDSSAIDKTLNDIKSRFRAIDVLVNNAGIPYLLKYIDETSARDLDLVYSLYMKGPFLITMSLLPLLRASKSPLVVNIASAAAFTRMPGEAVYSAAKSGMVTLMEIAREELQKHRIRVSIIEPYGVNTQNIPNPKDFLRPEDIGRLVKFIVDADPNCEILSVSLSSTGQWRQGTPPWVPKRKP